jgi:hypothetical protein
MVADRKRLPVFCAMLAASEAEYDLLSRKGRTMTRRLFVAVASVAAISAPITGRALQTSQVSLSMADVMTAKEFDAAGLRKLSPDELRVMNSWLNAYTRRVLAITQGQTTSVADPPAASAVIESQIDGDFNGWEGETIFKLRNGQIWQQSSYAYTYHYAYAPKVLIYKSGASYKMKVDGVDREISVKRLK